MVNEILKVAKHKQALKHREIYIHQRDEIVRQIVGCPTPNWGGLKLTLINW